MFERRIVPVYLALAALALAVWSSSGAPGNPPTLLVTVLGMAALYAVAATIHRRTPVHATVPQEIDAAARLNAARIAPPSDNRGSDPRR